MSHDSIRLVREELPAHGAWVRRLARSLMRDEASAEDLAQEANLAALRGGAAVRGALGPWLARVTRNFARRGWRDAARRARHEQAAARPELLPGADEAAARLEIQRRLVEELAALEPAFRHALVRHYFDGWTAARIAHETAEPAATVRWRLQRGLAELRARLARRGADGIDWRFALLPLCGKAAPWAALTQALRPLVGAGTIQGALTMKAASQALAAVALVAAVGVGVWWSVERVGVPRAAAAGEPGPPASALQEPARIRDDPAPIQPAARESVAAQPAPVAAAEPVAAGAPATALVDGRCVDEDLVPIGHARIAQSDQDATRATFSARDGGFSLEDVPDRWAQSTLAIEAAGFATRFLPLNLTVGETTHLGDVVLKPGGSVHGRVFGPDGAPFSGATVTVTSPDLWGSLEEVRVRGPLGSNMLGATSGADGRFEIGGAELGPMRAWAGAPGMRYAVSAPIEVRAHEATEEVELRLERIQHDDRITGVVLSPEGEPVPGAGLSGMERAAGSMSSFDVTADGDAAFQIEAKPNHVYDLEALDPQGRWASVEAKSVAPGTHDLEIRFQPARWLEVKVTTKEGTAIEDYEVAADSDEERKFDLFWRGKAGPHAGGTTRLLVPSHPFYVRVDARGFAREEEGPIDPADAPPTLAFALTSEPGLRGRVLANGAPLEGASVSLQLADPRTRIDYQGYATLCTPRPRDQTKTDGDGRFTLRVRAQGTYVVRAEAEGRAAADTAPLDLDPRVGRDDLELVLGRGGVLEGRVLVAPGRDPAGLIVALNRGDAHPLTQRSDDQGGFRFEGLTSGPWQLSRGKLEVNPKGGSTTFSNATTPTVISFNCTIREGETTVQDLDLRDFEPCALHGLLLVNGAPVKDWGVMAWPGAKEAMAGSPPPATATREDGSYALTLEESGPLRLSFSPPAESGAQGTIDERIELHPGANEWKTDLAMGRLSGRCLAPLPSEDQSLFFVADAGPGPAFRLPILPDANGRYVLPFVPAGRGAIKRLEKTSDAWVWTVLVETEIPARGERTLDVP